MHEEKYFDKHCSYHCMLLQAETAHQRRSLGPPFSHIILLLQKKFSPHSSQLHSKFDDDPATDLAVQCWH